MDHGQNTRELQTYKFLVLQQWSNQVKHAEKQGGVRYGDFLHKT